MGKLIRLERLTAGDQRQPAVELRRRLELERLDTWLLAVDEEIRKGNSLAAIDRGVRILDRRAKRLGLVEARGVTLVADGGDLRIRPGSRLTPELLDRLRAHKPELLDLLTWPDECLAAEREFGHPCGADAGGLQSLDRRPAAADRGVRRGCYALFLPGEVKPTG